MVVQSIHDSQEGYNEIFHLGQRNISISKYAEI